MRQHILGPYPLDPSLIAQGIPPDDRIDPGANLFGPTEGTPMPPGQPPAAANPTGGTADTAPPGAPAPAPGDADSQPGPAPTDGAAAGTPSGFSPRPRPTPAAVAIPYDPNDGSYVSPDGRLQRQAALVGGAPKSWKDLMPI
jgi:hypothetical protein